MVGLQILINNIRTTINAFVIDDLCTDVLLGSDYWDKYHVDISYYFKNLTIRSQHQQTRVKFEEHLNNRQIYYIKTLQDVMIPPLSAKIIQAITTAPQVTTAMFTPSSRVMNKQHVVAPHALLMINHNITAISLLNTTKSAKTIVKGTNLGTIEQQEDHRCCYVNPYRQIKQQPTSSPHYQPAHHCVSSVTSSGVGQKSTSSVTSTIAQLVSHLPTQQRQQLEPVLLKHSAVFDTSKITTINNNNVEHRIPVQPRHQPIQSYPYRKAAKETQIINEQVKEMLENHIIRPSTNYRKLNLITERDVYPLPRIDDIIDKLSDSNYFSTLDLKAGYWQISVAEGDKKKTAFVTTNGLYEFNVLPFGLSNAPSTFQRVINSVLGTLRWDIALVYLDDIIVYSPTFEKHVKHMDMVLTALEKANVKLNSVKCTLARKELDYLGYRITRAGIKPTSSNVNKTLDFPVPSTAKAAYSFVQMAQFYRR
ncbi:unnamed protein product, partial [Didymodactylos carnosus]